MAHATLRMNGKEFVLVPKAEFRKLTGRNQRDAQRAISALKKWRAGKLPTVSHVQLKRRLGL
jgi:hypothetical protein